VKVNRDFEVSISRRDKYFEDKWNEAWAVGELIARETKEVTTEIILEYCPHTSYGFYSLVYATFTRPTYTNFTSSVPSKPRNELKWQLLFGFCRINGYLSVLLISVLYRKSQLGFCNEDGYLGIADVLLLALFIEGGYSGVTSTHLLGFCTEIVY
jgi:hypothetical protein